MENYIFILLSFSAIAAIIASPVHLFNSRKPSRQSSFRHSDERGEIILLNDLHLTCFRKK